MHEAFQYFSKAAEGRYFRGIVALAFCYLFGIGTDQNLCKARENFEIALKMKNESVQQDMMMYHYDKAELDLLCCKLISFYLAGAYHSEGTI